MFLVGRKLLDLKGSTLILEARKLHILKSLVVLLTYLLGILSFGELGLPVGKVPFFMHFEMLEAWLLSLWIFVLAASTCSG